MNDIEYLGAVLKSQDLPDDSSELRGLQETRAAVEKVLREGFEGGAPTIKYGGSKAKGTLIKENFDLDMVCYFANDDTAAGETLEDIYNNVAGVLGKHYTVDRKRSALRLMDARGVDFHVDVVPGRYTGDTNGDCFLHQEQGNKERLKTNIVVHIDHVKGSGVSDALRLLKLWKTRKALPVKQFAFELLCIDLLDGTTLALPDQLKLFWAEIRDAAGPILVEDPANPTGNDLTDLITGPWGELASVSADTLSDLESGGWEAVFGALPSGGDSEAKVSRAATATAVPTKPWMA